MYNLEKAYVFVYDNLPERYFEQDERSCFKVFYDSELTRPVDINVNDEGSKNRTTISPNRIFSYKETNSEGTWGSHTKFWLLQYVDLETGEMLDTPLITVFTKREDDLSTKSVTAEEEVNIPFAPTDTTTSTDTTTPTDTTTNCHTIMYESWRNYGVDLAGCTLFASTGMELKVLQDLMGHADAQVTLNVYNHKSQERTAREMQRIDNEINL